MVASRSFQEYSAEELDFHLNRNPFSFLHIINPDYKLQKKFSGTERFEMIRNRYLEFRKDKILLQDENPSYYIYKTTIKNQSYCGIIAAASAEEYEKDIIKKHEDTIAQREKLFKDYLEIVGFNTEPVLLTYSDSELINHLLAHITSKKPEYEFKSYNKETHVLWLVNDPVIISKIKDEFEKIPVVYIADGHHRSASSALLAKDAQAANAAHTGKESYNFFMSYLIAESNLKLYEFNRLVKDLNGLTKNEFLGKLDEWFRMENRGEIFYKPSKKHHFSMYLNGEYYSLYLRKNKYTFKKSLDKLDPFILSTKILDPVLGVKDLKDDHRIAYIPGKDNPLTIKRAVDNKEFKVGFGMLPLGIEELKQLSNEGLTMPPKSTYIEPKLRSGLTVYEF